MDFGVDMELSGNASQRHLPADYMFVYIRKNEFL